MKDGPVIAPLAALLGDPARANMLTALMDGRALTVSELAQAAGVTLQTASGHLAKLDAAGLLAAEKQGRHRYVRLSGPDVAQVVEGLMALAQRTGAVRVRTGPKDAALRRARVCYDHLAGEWGVALMRALVRQAVIAGEDEPFVTPRGRAFFTGIGIDMDGLERGRGRRLDVENGREGARAAVLTGRNAQLAVMAGLANRNPTEIQVLACVPVGCGYQYRTSYEASGPTYGPRVTRISPA
jgi:DNA-binding transcriptional ArsR family regulator